MTTDSGLKPGDIWNHMEVIACGPNRVCVIDRRDTRQCLKFMLPLHQRPRVGLRQRLKRRRAIRSPTRDENHAELRAWLKLAARVPVENLRGRIATVLGIFPTVYGTALCCERITLADGTPAPSLSSLLSEPSQYPAQMLCAAVSEFEQWLLRHRIPAFDLNPGNLLVLPSETSVTLVCVDAKSIMSDKGILPFSHWFNGLAKRKVRHCAQQLRERIRAALPS